MKILLILKVHIHMKLEAFLLDLRDMGFLKNPLKCYFISDLCNENALCTKLENNRNTIG